LILNFEKLKYRIIKNRISQDPDCKKYFYQILGSRI